MKKEGWSTDEIVVRILEDQAVITANCVGCIHSVRGVCAFLCAVPKGRCRYYETAKGGS